MWGRGEGNFLEKVSLSPPPPPHAPSPLPSKTFPLIESLFAVFSKWQPELNDGSCLFVWD